MAEGDGDTAPATDEDATAAAEPGAPDDAAGTDTVAEGDGDTAPATDEDATAAAESGAPDDAAGTDTVAEGDGDVASATDEDATAAAEPGAADDVAGADTMAATGDGTAPAAEEDEAATTSAETTGEDAAGADTMAEGDDGTAPTTKVDEEATTESAATADGTQDTTVEGATETAAGDVAPLATEEGAEEAEQPIVETRVVPDEPVEQAQEPPTVAPDVSEEMAPDEEPAPAVMPPSFDTVRIKPDGSAVIAGRAPPGAEVTVKSEDVNLGSETANRSGEWTLVPYTPIPPGDHQFSAIATLPDGTQVESDEVLIVSIPEPDEDGGAVLALLAPRDGEGGSKILQKSDPAPEKVEPEPAPEVEEEPSIELARPDTAPADEAGPGEEQLDVARPEETPEEEPMDLASRDPAGSDEAGSGEVAAPDETMTAAASSDDAGLEEDGSEEPGTDAASESAGDAPAAPLKARIRARSPWTRWITTMRAT